MADHAAAGREAARICGEYPRLIQPDETAYNLALAYLELAAEAGGGHDVSCDCVLHRGSGTSVGPSDFLPAGCT